MYNKKEWVSKEVITKEALNNMENGIADNDTKLHKKVYYFNNVSDMKQSTLLEAGDMVKTLGYFDINDGGNAEYVISNVANNAVDDGGSVILLNNNLQANLIVGNGVDCRLFGCGNRSLSKDDLIQRFDNWVNYVNNTNGKYFAPTGGTTFSIYKPLLLKKSIIGINDPIFMYMGTVVGSQIVSNTEQACNGNNHFNVSAVIAVKQTANNENDRLKIKGLQIYCTNVDDDTNPAQDYGLYIPVINNFEIHDIFIIRPNQAGLKIYEGWMGEISDVNVWHSRKAGFELKGTFTSLHVSNCYAHGFTTKGWDINGVVYSNFESLAADTANATISYAIASCWGTNFSGLGTENGTRDHILYLGDFTGEIKGVFVDGVEIKEDILFNYAPSNFSLNGIKYRNLKIAANKTPYSFNITSSSASQKIELNVDNDNVVAGSYTMKLNCNDTLGTLVVNKTENSFVVKKGIRKYNHEGEYIFDLGRQQAELSVEEIYNLITFAPSNRPHYYRYSYGIYVIEGSIMYSDSKYYCSELRMDFNSANGFQIRKYINGSFNDWQDISTLE